MLKFENWRAFEELAAFWDSSSGISSNALHENYEGETSNEYFRKKFCFVRNPNNLICGAKMIQKDPQIANQTIKYEKTLGTWSLCWADQVTGQ